jgi:cellulose synthase/poly-beta-1,6-N-acetylglucosamine synthase-like glycosyltransferase
MGPQYLIYPLLAIALFFEVFMLITFLSSPARFRRERGRRPDYYPSVAMIVPCWNEEATIKENIESLLALDYPEDKLSIVAVNDGSTDRSGEILDEAFKDHPRVIVMHQENGGKHAALNAGIARAEHAEFVGCLDADSFVEHDALKEIISSFDDPRVAATTVSMSVHNPRNLLEIMQNVEYIMGIAFRHVLSSVNGIYVTPGPFSLYRRDIILKVGGFRYGHQTEDMEMALRLQREGYWIENAPRARVYTKVPTTVGGLIQQRTRWTTGFLRNVFLDYRDLIGNYKYGVLGLLVLPLGFIAVFGGIALFATFLVVTVQNLWQAYEIHSGVPFSYTVSQTLSFNLDWFYLPVTMLGLLGAVAVLGFISFILIGKQVSRTPGGIWWGLFLYTLIYRWITPLWLIRSVRDLVTGAKRPWR